MNSGIYFYFCTLILRDKITSSLHRNKCSCRNFMFQIKLFAMKSLPHRVRKAPNFHHFGSSENHVVFHSQLTWSLNATMHFSSAVIMLQSDAMHELSVIFQRNPIKCTYYPSVSSNWDTSHQLMRAQNKITTNFESIAFFPQFISKIEFLLSSLPKSNWHFHTNAVWAFLFENDFSNSC